MKNLVEVDEAIGGVIVSLREDDIIEDAKRYMHIAALEECQRFIRKHWNKKSKKPKKQHCQWEYPS